MPPHIDNLLPVADHLQLSNSISTSIHPTLCLHVTYYHPHCLSCPLSLTFHPTMVMAPLPISITCTLLDTFSSLFDFIIPDTLLYLISLNIYVVYVWVTYCIVKMAIICWYQTSNRDIQRQSISFVTWSFISQLSAASWFGLSCMSIDLLDIDRQNLILLSTVLLKLAQLKQTPIWTVNFNQYFGHWVFKIKFNKLASTHNGQNS